EQPAHLRRRRFGDDRAVGAPEHRRQQHGERRFRRRHPRRGVSREAAGVLGRGGRQRSLAGRRARDRSEGKHRRPDQALRARPPARRRPGLCVRARRGPDRADGRHDFRLAQLPGERRGVQHRQGTGERDFDDGQV
ncbi:MAG: Flagellar basal-body rod protein FlgC, partial [uncultured Lysobacter sp.]